MWTTENALQYIREQQLPIYKERPIKIMEVCGTHTSSIVKNGLRELLPSSIRLVSGPGCPVCVTEPGYIDALIGFALEENTCVLSFGDMLKVRGSAQSLSEAASDGANFQIVYSPFEAIELAKNNPQTRYIFAAVGFETTIPLYALMLETIEKERLENLKLATSLKIMIPALSYICAQEEIDAFLCPGHVSVIIGADAFEPLCHTWHKPFVIAGFEPEHIIGAIAVILSQLATNQPSVVNLYKNAVQSQGNEKALNRIRHYFTTAPGVWRGIGTIEGSALILKKEFEQFQVSYTSSESLALPPGCRCADVLMGRILPIECPLFGKVCTRQNPIGACMTSSEGACGIWYQNR
jgi:hydrogenase expression/formation protein HypD